MRDVRTLHVASCSVEYSVDHLHCCALSTGSAKGEQLSKALLLRRDDRLRRAREEAGTLERRRASDRALTISGPQGNYILHLGGDSG